MQRVPARVFARVSQVRESMTSAQQAAFVAALRLYAMKSRLSDGERTLAGARRLQAGGPARPPGRLGAKVHLSRDDALGFPVHTLRPKRPAMAPGRTVLYLHGGGYVNDFVSQHWAFMASLADRTGATVIAPQYPLAPDHTWRDSFRGFWTWPGARAARRLS